MSRLVIEGSFEQISELLKDFKVENAIYNAVRDEFVVGKIGASPVAEAVPTVPAKPQNPPQEKPIKQSHKHKTKVCAECGKDFIPNGGRQIYCDNCKHNYKHKSPKPVSSGEEEPR